MRKRNRHHDPEYSSMTLFEGLVLGTAVVVLLGICFCL